MHSNCMTVIGMRKYIEFMHACFEGRWHWHVNKQKLAIPPSSSVAIYAIAIYATGIAIKVEATQLHMSLVL